MKTTLITTVLLSVLLAPAPGASAAQDRDRAEARQERREVRDERATSRDDAGDLETLRHLQVELARARVESDTDAVAGLDARVMEMLRDERNEARTRVASEWAQLEGRYERQDLERRVLLLDELVDAARAEAAPNERGRREIKDHRREEDEADGRGRIQPGT